MATAQIPSVCFHPHAKSGIRLRLFASRVPAGFPSPADDYVERSIDLNDWLIKNKLATFIVEKVSTSLTSYDEKGVCGRVRR